MLDHETGRRAVLALTDGEDTFSQSATLDSVIAAANRIGLPVYTLGLGTEEEIESKDLRRLAVSTRGQYYPAADADQLRAIYEQIAERLNSSYTLMYQSDRKIRRRHAQAGSHRLSGQHQIGRRDGRLHSRHGRSLGRVVAAIPRAVCRARRARRFAFRTRTS